MSTSPRRLGAVALSLLALGDLATAMLVLEIREPEMSFELATLALPDRSPLPADEDAPLTLELIMSENGAPPRLAARAWETELSVQQAVAALSRQATTHVAIAVRDSSTFGAALQVQEALESAGIVVSGYGKAGAPR